MQNFARRKDTEIAIVVPCFNEAKRWRMSAWIELCTALTVRYLFVDDGSTDGTRAILGAVCTSSDPQRVSTLHLPKNAGKAEAVRRGMLWALKDPDTEWVGFFDADLATPPEEIIRITELLSAECPPVMMGSRVKLLGSQIERRAARHVLGRLFATAASSALQIPVYDSQCGAKFFRASATLRAALACPFLSRWVFDIELLGRLLYPAPGVNPLDSDSFAEVPLRAWRDVSQSRLKLADFFQAAIDLAQIRRQLSRDIKRRQILSSGREQRSTGGSGQMYTNKRVA